MRTVHAYTPTQQQQPQQQQQPALSSSSTTQANMHHHSSTSGYLSVRHSLLRMHSQLRSAPNGRQSAQGPIDLSLYRSSRQTPKVTTRSSSSAATTVETVPTITPLITSPTRTIYGSSISSSSTSSKPATAQYNHEEKRKVQNLFSCGASSKYSSFNSRSMPIPSPRLAYSYTNIEENLQCPLCIDRLRDPRALPCQHVFCCSCLKSIPSSNLPYPSITCPLCRRTCPYNGADQFPVSYIHRQLLELVPKNYDVNGKCTRCEEKTSLILCSCCDYLLCQKCFLKDREKVIDNVQHTVQACYYRLNRIHATRDQLIGLNETNRKKIHQIETMFADFERHFLEHKQSILNSLNKHNERIIDHFWSRLNIPTHTTEPFIALLNQAELLMKQSHSAQFDDILSVYHNLNSLNEQLEHANTLIDTYDIKNLLKQTIQINNNNNNNQLDQQVCVSLNQNDNTEKILPLMPSTSPSRSTKRLRKTEPKRHVEQGEDEENYDDDDSLPILKQMKVECHNDLNFDNVLSPANSVLCLNFSGTEHQQDEFDNDDDIIYIETIQAKSPVNISLDELFELIEANE